jgi:transposase-like protein
VIDGNRRVAEVARELDLHENLPHPWVRDERRRMAAAGAGPRSDPVGGEPLSAEERAELVSLRAQVACDFAVHQALNQLGRRPAR